MVRHFLKVLSIYLLNSFFKYISESFDLNITFNHTASKLTSFTCPWYTKGQHNNNVDGSVDFINSMKNLRRCIFSRPIPICIYEIAREKKYFEVCVPRAGTRSQFYFNAVVGYKFMIVLRI